MNGLGVATRHTRIPRYLHYLEELEAGRFESHSVIFSDPATHPFRHPVDRMLYVLREVHELQWIYHGLKGAACTGLASRLLKVVGGADFAVYDKNTLSRDTQFELRVAAYFGRGGYSVDLSTETDVIAADRSGAYHVECKRLGSAKQVARRLREADRQLSLRLPPDTSLPPTFGLVALDVTRLALTKNGLTLGATADHVRDILHEKIKTAADAIARYPFFHDGRVLGVFLQIHIPTLLLNPPQVETRFTPGLVDNPGLDVVGRQALERFRTLLPFGTDPKMSHGPPRARELRRAVQFDPSIRFAWDDEVLAHILATGSLPAGDEATVVCTFIEGERETDYLHGELAWALAQISNQRMDALRADKPALVGELVTQLYLHRHRYVR
jgi:hypothetical protein